MTLEQVLPYFAKGFLIYREDIKTESEPHYKGEGFIWRYDCVCRKRDNEYRPIILRDSDILANDWFVVDCANEIESIELSFIPVLTALKNGAKIRRESWDKAESSYRYGNIYLNENGRIFEQGERIGNFGLYYFGHMDFFAQDWKIVN